MITINESDIEKDLPAFFRRVEAGDIMVITKEGKPLAEIRPLSGQITQQRPIGLCAGAFVVPDDFDMPLPENIIENFEGS